MRGAPRSARSLRASALASTSGSRRGPVPRLPALAVQAAPKSSQPFETLREPGAAEDGPVQVFSWAAPIAHAFYGTEGYPPLEGKVQITRVFQHRADKIVDFDDERLDPADEPTPFDRATVLRIPRPPASSKLSVGRTDPPLMTDRGRT